MAAPTRARRAAGALLQLAVGMLSVVGALVVYKRLLFPLIDGSLHPADPWHTILARVGSLVAAACAYFAFVRAYERRSPAELAFRPRALALGAASGAALISITLAVLFATGHFVVESYRSFLDATPVVLTILTAAMVEEIVFRGLLFRIAEQHAGTLPALAVVSLLFGVLHVFNNGTTPATVVSVTMLGALWCGIFVLSRNLWVTGLNHTAWNLTIFLSGTPLSGQQEWRGAAPLVTHVRGPDWLTGGGFGPEDSAISIVVVAITVTLLLRHLVRAGLLRRITAAG